MKYLIDIHLSLLYWLKIHEILMEFNGYLTVLVTNITRLCNQSFQWHSNPLYIKLNFDAVCGKEKNVIYELHFLLGQYMGVHIVTLIGVTRFIQIQQKFIIYTQSRPQFKRPHVCVCSFTMFIKLNEIQIKI